VKRAVLWLTMIVLVAACENSADPLGGILGGGGGALTAAQATGSWLFTVQRTTTLPCSNALANGPQITAQLFVLSAGTVGTTSSWLNPISLAVEPVSGLVGLTDGITRLNVCRAFCQQYREHGAPRHDDVRRRIYGRHAHRSRGVRDFRRCLDPAGASTL